ARAHARRLGRHGPRGPYEALVLARHAEDGSAGRRGAAEGVLGAVHGRRQGSGVTDTIFALATAPGRAGVAIFRLSGPLAGTALEQLGGRNLPVPRHAARRRFRDQHGHSLDDGIALWFPAPASFTGEDVAELHVHGGRAVREGVAESLLALGLRPAE